MWPCVIALAVVSLFPIDAAWVSLVVKSNSSQGVSIRRSRFRQSQEPSDDEGESQVANVAQGALDAGVPQVEAPCSCECCEVQKLLPQDFVKLGDKTITSGCSSAKRPADTSVDLVSGSGQEGLCPGKCQITGGTNAILSSAKGAIDYDRFCNYNCQPLTDDVGTACVQFDKEYYEKAKADPTGNGAEVFPIPVHGIGSGFEKKEEAGGGGGFGTAGGEETSTEGEAGAGTTASQEEAEEQAEAAAKSSQQKVNIIYDLRKLVSERLRSEAGAAVASASAAAERVRMNQFATKKHAAELDKLRARQDAIGSKVDEGVAIVEEDQSEADKAETKTKKDLAEGRIFATTMVNKVRSLAEEAIKKAVTPCAEQAARDRARAKGLDKPEDWVKVVAARAANPYQNAVTTAVMRTAEYKNQADGLMGQAYAAQKQANTLVSHVNALEAQGDLIGATIEKKQVSNLLSKARGLESQAKGFWETAQKTRETIPKWQMAASQAAAYASWEYANNAQAFR